MIKEQTITIQKRFLDVNDIVDLFGCCKTKAYDIMRDVNYELKKKGLKVYNGKVLATALYRAYGMEA